MNTALMLAAPAADSSPAVTVSVLLFLIAIGVVLCVYVGHRWSTLITGILIGLFLTGDFADTTKTVVTQILTSTVNGISNSVG
ncbi:hypothetical protein [Streptomyces sp. 7N604]|uniref:hypothetical protein n=1 Tax=Streptomyces sp. 7N604 TaxID=3457415 RepID=UPI003FD60606